ncbi:MAG: DUF2306 domain-containing protein [Flavobacteriales bacterium]|nr:DUF2306 domain-containing protein [Flavobacteriales bacterium]
MKEIASYTFLSWAHLGPALLAMVFGALVLLRRKGTRGHRRTGYVYVAGMVVLNTTAFGMYRLFGTFGPFHVAAVVSALTVLAGMRAIRSRPRTVRQVELHLVFMYWSVLGLYAAFFSEVMVRVRINATFMVLVSIATAATILLGALFQNRLVRRWSAEVQGARPE